MSYFCQNQQRGNFSTSSVNVTNSIKYSIYMLVYNKSYLIKENGSILTQLKSMRPLPAHCVTVPPLPCAVHNLLMIVIIPSAGYFCISQQQRPGRWPCWRRACSTAALQTVATCSLQCCSAGLSTPRLYAARPGSCCSQRCHTARLLQHCSTYSGHAFA